MLIDTPNGKLVAALSDWEAYAMADIATLVDVLDRAARMRPDFAPLTFIDSTERPPTNAELDGLARVTAARLTTLTRPGDRVLLVMPTGSDFVATFFGCLYAGVLPVPCPPPLPGSMAERFAAITADCTPSLLVTDRDWVAMLSATGVPTVVSAHDLCESPGHAGDFVAPDIAPSDPAYLQYTGGTTGSPRGIVLTHANVVANLGLASAANALTRDDLLVGWLPLFHDLGLVSQVLQPIYDGYSVVLMQPQDFVADPARLLREVSDRSATLAALPGFAYDMLLRRIPPFDRAALALDSLRIARTGAEVLEPSQMTAFLEGFAPAGLKPVALSTGYGLGESVLHVCIAAPNTPPVIVQADRESLTRGEVRRGVAGVGTVPLAGSGRPGPGVRVVIASLDDRHGLPAGDVGEIMVAGSSVSAGYWGESDSPLTAVDGEEGFLPTGDLGCLVGGELFVLGRRADLIIVGDRWLFPADIERTAASAGSGIRAHACAVFATDRGVVLVAETSRPDAVVTDAIATLVAAWHSVELADIRLVGRGAIPMTTSGKIRRRHCRELYLRNALV